MIGLIVTFAGGAAMSRGAWTVSNGGPIWSAALMIVFGLGAVALGTLTWIER